MGFYQWKDIPLVKQHLRKISMRNIHAKWIGAGKIGLATDFATIQT